ncbi:MAG TPA: copper resistance CopC family protein [Acidimicrobiales bacterium]|nr:copper resistance CopC family protein [Acidimicrobiales bacterium]
MTPTSPVLRVVVRLAAAAALLPGLGLALSAPAGAHAVVVGTVPADKTRVEHLPDRITIYLNAKPATVEGDPVSIYDPGGTRIDDGDVRVEEDGQVLSVGVMQPGGPAVMGDYEVVYRIVSADSHLIVGRFGFHVHPHEAEAAPAPAAPAASPDQRKHWLRRAGPLDVRPELALGLVMAVGGAVAARRRTAAPARRRNTPPPARRRVGPGYGGGRA